jgi:hypothetical protein
VLRPHVGGDVARQETLVPAGPDEHDVALLDPDVLPGGRGGEVLGGHLVARVKAADPLEGGDVEQHAPPDQVRRHLVEGVSGGALIRRHRAVRYVVVGPALVANVRQAVPLRRALQWDDDDVVGDGHPAVLAVSEQHGHAVNRVKAAQLVARAPPPPVPELGSELPES